MAFFQGKKSASDIINDSISDDEVVASDVPPRYLLFFSFGEYDGSRFRFILKGTMFQTKTVLNAFIPSGFLSVFLLGTNVEVFNDFAS